METHPGIIDAATAMRTWVRTQRATWTEPKSVPAVRAASVPPPPVALFTPTAASPPVLPDMPLVRPQHVLPFEPVALPEVVPSADPQGHLATPAPEPHSVDRTPAVQARSEDEPSVPLLSRGWLRGVAAVVVLGALAAAGAVGWNRFVGAGAVGTVAFDSKPAGSQVLVDGNAVGETPVELELPTGRHAVEFRSKTGRRTQDVQVRRAQKVAVAVDWNAKVYGRLQVSSTPDAARVLVDGRERGTTPLTLDDVVVGSHTVVIESSEGTVRRKVEVREGKTEALNESIYSGWLKVDIPIEITVVDNGRAVQLDDSNRVLLKPGTHALRIENRKLGFGVSRQVDIEPGGTATVSLEVAPSTLSVTGTAGAEVFVDGVRAGTIPLSEFQVKLGRHDLMIVAPGGETRHSSVTVGTAPAQLDVTFTKP